MKKTKIDKKLILYGKVVKIKIDLFLKMAFKFDNIYEKNVYDEWNRTIKRMGSYRIRKQYYPHKMETYETKKRTLDFIKNGLLKSYKIHKFYFNQTNLKDYFPDNMNNTLKEVRKDINERLQKLTEDRDLETHWEKNVKDIMTLERQYLITLFNYYENAYLNKQANDTMVAAQSLLMLQEKKSIKKRTKNENVLPTRRSKRIQQKNDPSYQHIRSNWPTNSRMASRPY
tara:strand:+ start:6040 stop:6723 length:684 start_codon:yes stop_codon:yes gene_type:complete